MKKPFEKFNLIILSIASKGLPGSFFPGIREREPCRGPVFSHLRYKFLFRESEKRAISFVSGDPGLTKIFSAFPSIHHLSDGRILATIDHEQYKMTNSLIRKPFLSEFFIIMWHNSADISNF